MSTLLDSDQIAALTAGELQAKSCLQPAYFTPLKEAPQVFPLADGELKQLWANCIAESLLFSPGMSVPEPFSCCEPYGHGITAAVLSAIEQRACVHIPLRSSSGEPPQIWRVALFADPNNQLPAEDDRDMLDGLSDWMDGKNLKVYIRTPYPANQVECTGKSWQQGLHLATLALQNLELRKKLAHGWLVTGTVQDKTVGSIELGNKLELRHKWQWLLPIHNLPQARATAAAHIKMHGVRNIDDAVSQLLGHGYSSKNEATHLPQADTLITFCSKARLPVIEAALLLRPKNIHLLHSDDKEFSKEPAVVIEEVIAQLLRDTKISKTLTSSTELADIENTVEKIVANGTGSTVFAATSGTLLQRLAAQSVLLRHPHVPLIYVSEGDKQAGSFTLIDYCSVPATTCQIKTSCDNLPEDVQAAALRQPDFDGCDAKKLLDKIGKIPEPVPYRAMKEKTTAGDHHE